MIVALSTSSPLTSVALIGEAGDVLWDKFVEAPGRASETAIRLLEEGLISTGLDLGQSSLFVSDQGPGSFTGVRVGVVIAKTFGWSFGVPCAGVDAFDLIDPELPVFIPSRKGEFFLRIPGEEVKRVTDLVEGAVGYGRDSQNLFPQAARVSKILGRLERIGAEALMPKYRMEPSISVPKRPLSRIQPQ